MGTRETTIGYVCRPSEPNVSHTLASTPFITGLLSHHPSVGGECDDTMGLCVSVNCD